MKYEMYIPQPGDGLYEKLFEEFERVFWEPKLLGNGLVVEPNAVQYYPVFITRASEIIHKYGLCEAALNVDYYNSNIAPIFLNNAVLICMVWVLLRIQPDYDKASATNARFFEEIVVRELKNKPSFLNNLQNIIKSWKLRPIAVHKLLKAEALFQEAMENVSALDKKCVSLSSKVEEDAEEIIRLKTHAMQIERENRQIETKVQSDEFRKKVGQEYLSNVFDEFFKEVEEWDSDQRIEAYHVLSLFLDFGTVPKEVKKKIRALNKRTGSKGTTVIAQPGSTVNNNDIHDNNEVNTK